MSVPTPLRIPEHLSPADIGAYMRDLRTHYGLSEHDVSQQLHIRPKYVTAIEQADFSAMPGKAYARGYVHTYAEFLGLDADQVAERCFGADAVQPAIPQPRPQAVAPRGWKWPLLIVLVGMGGVYAAMQYAAPDMVDDVPAIAQVEEVPEDYLDGLRTLYMPLPDATPCLEGTLLGCFYGQQALAGLTHPAVPDMAPMRVDPPAEPEHAEEKASEGQE